MQAIHDLSLPEGFFGAYGQLNHNLFEFAKNTIIFNIFEKKYFNDGDDSYRKENLQTVAKNMRNLLRILNL